ncbi:MAG: hypothetical protein KZQ97_21485 [Candidatus Thiodiazotropha sp. (ex Dulcina madagascariensis)]|nr:hypothetical protein [Candidatus Thiodiazotropha sp. (ex Dulcina madagascariensis)]
MFKKIAYGIIQVIFISLIGTPTALAAENCKPIGGVATANFYPEGKGKPVIISASMFGSVSHAAGKIIAQKKTATGMEMDMEHYFGTAEAGGMRTKDLGILTAVPGKPGRYMIEITYTIQEDVTRGTLKGYKGQFNSFGLVDLRDANDMKGLVRYSGEICK